MAYNIEYDDGDGGVCRYLQDDVSYSVAERYLARYKERYENKDGTPKAYPNGKGYFKFSNPRIVRTGTQSIFVERALFTSRTSALRGAIDVARRIGWSEEKANLFCRVYPRYEKGNLVGYEAWFPKGGGFSPVLEEDV